MITSSSTVQRRTSPALQGRQRDLRASAPVPRTVVDLLARSDAELGAAELASDPAERFVHGHLAALRAGAALLEVTGRPVRRPMPRTVWDMVAAVAPELSAWAGFFAAGATTRAAVESGRDADVDEARADRTVAAAEDFQDAVRALVLPSLEHPLDLEAS